MSLNQSRVERAEQHTRKSGRSSGPGNQRGFHNANAVKGGAAGAGSSAPPPSSSSNSSLPSATANRSFKKSNGQGGQSRVSNIATNSEVTINRAVQNGTLLHNQKPVVPLPGPSGTAGSVITKQIEHSLPKNAQPPPWVPTSHYNAGSSESASMASPSGDVSKMFPLQFGTITPSFMNGMPIPARTSSAPPNLDEQKRDQARHDGRPGPVPISVAAKQQQKQQPQPPQLQLQHQQKQQPRKDLGSKFTNVVETHHPVQPRRDATTLQIPVPPQTSSAKPSVLPLGGGSMPISFQQSQVTTQFGTPNAQQSQTVSAASLQMPLPLAVGNPAQVQQPVFVPGLQSHPLQAQGMIHQSQGLGYSPQMNHQLAPQLGNMGIAVPPPQFPQSAVNKFGAPRKAVKITDPKTHEELRLDKRTDSFVDASSSGQTVQLARSHAVVATQSQQPIPSFPSAHQISYYSTMQPNSYTPSIFYAGQAAHPLANASVGPGSSAARYGYPVSHGGTTVSVGNPSALNTSLPLAMSGPSAQVISEPMNLETVTAPVASVQVTVKPPTGSISGKIGSSTTTLSVDSSSTNKGAVLESEPVKLSRHHEESGSSHLQRGEGARLISSAMGQILAQLSSSTVSSPVGGDDSPESCFQRPKSSSGTSFGDTLPATVKHPAPSAATVEQRQSSTVSSANPIILVEEAAHVLTNREGRKWDPLKKSDSFKDQQKLNRQERQLSESLNQACDSSGNLKPSTLIASKIDDVNSDHGSGIVEFAPGALDVILASMPPPSLSFKLENSNSSEVVGVSERKNDKTLLASSGSSVSELGTAEASKNSETISSVSFDRVPIVSVTEEGGLLELSGSVGSEAVVNIPENSVSCSVMEEDQVPHDGRMSDKANETTQLEDKISKTPSNSNLESLELLNMPPTGCSDISNSTGASSHQVPVVDKVEEPEDTVGDALEEDTIVQALASSAIHHSAEATGVEIDNGESLADPNTTQTLSEYLETDLSSASHSSMSEYEKHIDEGKMPGGEIVSQAESISSSQELGYAVPEVAQKDEARVPENINSGVSVSSLSSSRDKVSLEQSKPKNVSGKKKKKREFLFKADAAGTTADLYMAYKMPEENHDIAVSENVNAVSSSIDSNQISEGDTEKHAPTKEEDSYSKSELDDWEEAAEISSPKLKTLEKTEQAGSKKCNEDRDGGSVGKKRYTRDFLMTFSEQCRDLPPGFGIGSDIADLLLNVQVNVSSFIDRDMYHMGGRILDRQSSGSSRIDRRGSGNMDEDRWNKLTTPFVPARTDLAYGIAGPGFRPGQGGNMGVLKNPRGQPGGQYVTGILSGPMQSLPSPGGLPRLNADADRWQRAAPVQKGLIPSPHSQPVVMHKAEKRYEVGKVSDEEETKQRQLKSILNKLTPQNFEKLFAQVKEVNIDNVVTLTGVISQIFDKALMEPTFCEMYADFCSQLAGALPDLGEGNEKVTFRRLLLNKCQEEFERGEKEEAEADKVGEEGEAKQSAEEREEKRVKARRRMLGNIRLIGELYKKKMLTERIMHECIKKLLGQYENPEEEDVEALCKLMSTIGAIIDHPIAKEHMDAYFDRMYNLSSNQKLSSRMRFLLRDTIDLRKNKWQQRRKVEGPKKIEEVHRDAAQERQAQTGRASRGSSMSSSTRRGQVIDYGLRGATGLPSPGAQQLGSLRGMPTSARFGTQDVRLEDRHIHESRTMSVPLPQRSIDDDSITLGPQGGLAKGMSMRGQPLMSSGSINDTPMSPGDARRIAMGLSGSSSTYSLTDFTPHSSREEVSSRGLLPDRPKSAHSYGQPNHQDRISRDERDTQSSSSAHNSSEKFPEEHLREKSMSAIKEFYSANDEDEVASCVKELNAPNFYPTMVSLWVTDSFERKIVERDRLTKLLVFLCKSRNHLLSQLQLIKGFKSVFATLPDAIYDAPRAAEFLGGMLAKVILENIVTLRDVGRLIHEAGEEPGSLTESGIASDVLGSIFEVIQMEKGDTVLKEIRRNSDIQLEEFLPPDSRKQAKLVAFI